MQLVNFWSHENSLTLVVKYDEKLLLFIVMEANKLLCLTRLERLLIFIHKWILKVYFTSHHINNNKHIHGHHIKGACSILEVFY